LCGVDGDVFARCVGGGGWCCVGVGVPGSGLGALLVEGVVGGEALGGVDGFVGVGFVGR